MSSYSRRRGVRFPSLLRKPVDAAFDEPETTSDGGLILLRAVDDRVGVSRTLSAFWSEKRQNGKVVHDGLSLIRQRIYALACGYEDVNDATYLRHDPLHRAVIGRDEVSVLASQPTLSRFENSVSRTVLMRLGLSLMDTILAAQHRRLTGRKVRRITIDLDPSDDPAHGDQEGIAYNGHYQEHCYLPLFAWVSFNDEPEQVAVAALLRSGCSHPTEGSFWVLRQLIGRLRWHFPKARLRVRLDGGFSSPELYRYLEAEGLEYLVGIGQNSVLRATAADLAHDAWSGYERTRQTVTHFGETHYAARTWRGVERRIVIKAEVVSHPGRLPRENVRFVVTNLRHKPENLYQVYRERGDTENRLKELFNGLSAGRTSCTRFVANQFRLLLTLGAYALMQELRRLVAPQLRARPQVGTLRLMLLKIGGRVRRTHRRIALHLADSCPWKDIWRGLARRLGAIAVRT